MQQNKSVPHRTQPSNHSLLQTAHPGFNYFHEINFPSFKSEHRRRVKTLTTQRRNHSIGYNTEITAFNTICHESQMNPILQENRFKLQKLKTEVNHLRDQQFSDYIKKSIRYQGLLDINDNKKKRLPTLNSKVGEVIKKSLGDTSVKTFLYDATFMSIKLEGWKPESRQGHTCILYKDNVILIGGHCSHPFSKANIYSLEKNLWIKSIETPTARSYHSSLLYKNNFIITFGGMGVYNASRKCRECFNTISLLDLRSYQSKIIKMTNQQSIEPRRSHSASLMGKYMLVFGGMNTKKEYLNDLIHLDLKDLRWAHKEYTIEGNQLTNYLSSGLAKHTAIPHFKSRKSYPLYHADYSDNEGIYFFGGTNQEGEPNSVLSLAFNRYVPVLRKIHYSGKSPSQTDPIIERYSQNSAIIVSGDQYQREISIYQFKEQKFIQVSGYINKPCLGGLGSSLVVYRSCYYLFYGLGEEGYIGAIGNFYLTEKIEENQNKKKKDKIANQWKNFIRTLDNGDNSSWADSVV